MRFMSAPSFFGNDSRKIAVGYSRRKERGMKKLVWLVFGAGAAFFAYRAFNGWRAYKAYEGFAEAWVHENEADAARYGDAATVQHALKERAIRGTRGGAAMEALRGDRYEVESKTRTPD